MLPPVHIFTDGAAEENLPATAGGMLLCVDLPGKEFFAYRIPAATLASWLDDGRKQAINQVELHPVLTAANTWSEQIRGRDVIFWIDNESARHGLIRGVSPVHASNALIQSTWSTLVRLEVHPWFARVPSCGNPSDDPSREETAHLANKGWLDVSHKIQLG